MPRLGRVARAEVERRIRAGHDHDDIARDAGILRGSVRSIERGMPPAASGPPAPADSPSALPLASGPDALTGRGDLGEVGGLDAARKAAGSSTPPPAGTAPVPPESPRPGVGDGPIESEIPLPEDEVKAVIAFAQTLTVLSCRGFVAVRRVKIDGRVLARLSVLSPEEVAQLKLFAPAAAPYIRELLQHQKQIAAAVFAVSWILMVAGKFGTLKEQGIVMPPPKREDPAPPPPGAL